MAVTPSRNNEDLMAVITACASQTRKHDLSVRRVASQVMDMVSEQDMPLCDAISALYVCLGAMADEYVEITKL